MGQSSATATVEQTSVQWRALCSRADLVANSGVVAWVDGAQVALFFLPNEASDKQLYAVTTATPSPAPTSSAAASSAAWLATW